MEKANNRKHTLSIEKLNFSEEINTYMDFNNFSPVKVETNSDKYFLTELSKDNSISKRTEEMNDSGI